MVKSVILRYRGAVLLRAKREKIPFSKNGRGNWHDHKELESHAENQKYISRTNKNAEQK